VSKKRIIMIVAAVMISFAGTFIFGWLTKTTSVRPGSELNQPMLASQEVEMRLPAPEAGTVSTVDDSEIKKAMTEKQLKSLVYEVQEKVKEYEGKLQALEVREQRLQMAQDTLKKDIEQLNNLRIELASIVASLKGQRDKLLKSRVEIAKAEKANLMSIAATYDKMDAASACKILINMSRMEVDGEGSGLDDAVKILHYMADRTKAKLLAQLAVSEPDLAAAFCRRLKQIVESEPVLP